jgi:hypothetical protein
VQSSWLSAAPDAAALVSAALRQEYGRTFIGRVTQEMKQLGGHSAAELEAAVAEQRVTQDSIAEVKDPLSAQVM